MIESLLHSDNGAWSVPLGWEQGKGVFGGLIAGALVKAATQLVNDQERALRAVTLTFVSAPTVGPAELKATVVREGGSTTTVELKLLQAGVKTLGVATFARPRPKAEVMLQDPVRFDRQWQQAEVVAVEPPLAPVFTQHFEYRPTGPWPFSGADRAEAVGWLRPRQFSGRYDAALLVTMADGFWHSVHTRADAPRPSLTINYAVELYGDPAHVERHAPLYHHGITWVASNGLASERRTLWSPDGKLLAVNHQAIAVLE